MKPLTRRKAGISRNEGFGSTWSSASVTDTRACGATRRTAYVSERGKYLSRGPVRAHPVRQTRVELVEALRVLVREQVGHATGLRPHAAEVGEELGPQPVHLLQLVEERIPILAGRQH